MAPLWTLTDRGDMALNCVSHSMISDVMSLFLSKHRSSILNTAQDLELLLYLLKMSNDWPTECGALMDNSSLKTLQT